jgi:hypothetical protein
MVFGVHAVARTRARIRSGTQPGTVLEHFELLGREREMHLAFIKEGKRNITVEYTTVENYVTIQPNSIS